MLRERCGELARVTMLCKEAEEDPAVALIDAQFGGVPEGEQKLPAQCRMYPHLTA